MVGGHWLVLGRDHGSTRVLTIDALGPFCVSECYRVKLTNANRVRATGRGAGQPCLRKYDCA